MNDSGGSYCRICEDHDDDAINPQLVDDDSFNDMTAILVYSRFKNEISDAKLWDAHDASAVSMTVQMVS